MGQFIRSRTGFVLIEIIVVVAIILILAGAYLGLSRKGGKDEKSIPARAIEKVESVECRSNLNQVRQSLQMDTATGEAAPGRLDQGVTASVSRCPVSGQPYSYDPQAVKVWCTTPGHERY
jgi:prepilin-type N-terminal cleavage/methylation domain-containing protein